MELILNVPNIRFAEIAREPMILVERDAVYRRKLDLEATKNTRSFSYAISDARPVSQSSAYICLIPLCETTGP